MKTSGRYDVESTTWSTPASQRRHSKWVRNGTRLRPLTVTTPKPMLPAAGVPFLTHLLCRLCDAGVDHVVLSTSYRPEVFIAHFGDGAALGLELDYVTEEVPLGTGGGIRNVVD